MRQLVAGDPQVVVRTDEFGVFWKSLLFGFVLSEVVQ
jgi:hypothetical protein